MTPRAARFDPRSERVVWLAIFVVAFALRAAHLWGQARNNPFFSAPVMDEQMHHEWAVRIASGEGMGDKPYFRAPLYYELLGLLYRVTGPSIGLARTIGALIGSASCVLLAVLGTKLGGRRVGVVAGILAAVYWPFIVFDGELLSVVLEVLFLVLTMLLVVRAAGELGAGAESRSGRGAGSGSGPGVGLGSGAGAWSRGVLVFWGLGIVWGLAAITRPNALALAPAVALGIWRLASPRAPRRVARACGWVVLGAALVVAPVTVRNRVVGGEWVLVATNGGVNLYIGNNPQSDGKTAIVPGTRLDWIGGFEDTHRIAERDLGRKLGEAEVSDYWRDKAIAWMRENPGAWLRLMGRKVRLFFSPVELPNNQDTWFFARLSETSILYWIGFPVVAPLAAVGVWAMRRRRAWLVPAAFFVTYAASVILFFCPDRYRLPAIAPLILFAAAGLVHLFDGARARTWRLLTVSAAIGLAALVIVANNPPDRALFRRDSDGSGHHSLARYFLRTGDPVRAAEHARQVIELRPYDPTAHLTLAAALVAESLPNEADAQYKLAIEKAPEYPEARTTYAEFLAQNGRMDEARVHLEQVLALSPDRTDVRLALAKALVALHQDAAAFPHVRRVVASEPQRADARELLARIVDTSVAPADGIALLRGLADAFPADPFVKDELAWLLATAPSAALRNGAEAVRLSRDVQRLAGRPWPRFLSTLAAAYAETGEFELAVRCEEHAIRFADGAGDGAARPQMDVRLELYRARRPYHRE